MLSYESIYNDMYQNVVVWWSSAGNREEFVDKAGQPKHLHRNLLPGERVGRPFTIGDLHRVCVLYRSQISKVCADTVVCHDMQTESKDSTTKVSDIIGERWKKDRDMDQSRDRDTNLDRNPCWDWDQNGRDRDLHGTLHWNWNQDQETYWDWDQKDWYQSFKDGTTHKTRCQDGPNCRYYLAKNMSDWDHDWDWIWDQGHDRDRGRLQEQDLDRDQKDRDDREWHRDQDQPSCNQGPNLELSAFQPHGNHAQYLMPGLFALPSFMLASICAKKFVSLKTSAQGLQKPWQPLIHMSR